MTIKTAAWVEIADWPWWVAVMVDRVTSTRRPRLPSGDSPFGGFVKWRRGGVQISDSDHPDGPEVAAIFVGRLANLPGIIFGRVLAHSQQIAPLTCSYHLSEI